MKSAENIECAIRIGNAAKLLLCAHGMDDAGFIIHVVKDVRKQLDEIEAKILSFPKESK